MTDPIFESFLTTQMAEAAELHAASDLVDLEPVYPPGAPAEGLAQAFVAKMYCRGLVQQPDGEITEANEFHVGIFFAADYLRRANPFQVLTWLGPVNVWHPNIRATAICAGHIAPGTGVVDLVYRCFEIVTWYNWAPHDGLNPDACQWARNHQDQFPTDRRPLKRIETTEQSAGNQAAGTT